LGSCRIKVGTGHLIITIYGKYKTLFEKFYLFIVFLKHRMAPNTKFDEKLEGVDNFRAWKYRVMLILEENDLEDFVKEEVPEPDEDEAKAKYKKNLVREKRIIIDPIKDHLIPHISSSTTPKQMFDVLSRLYEGNNINRKITLRKQLKNVKMQSSETIQ
jgi:hypothetical protein